MEVRPHTKCSVCEDFGLSIYDICSIRCWNLGTVRDAWNQKRACFGTKKIFECFQSNSKHYGVQWNRTLSIVCPHCCQSCEMLVESSNNVSRKLVRKALSMDSTGKENWATWIRTYLCSHGVSPVWLYGWHWHLVSYLISDLNAKLTEMSAQNWQTNLHSSKRHDVYKNLKKGRKKSKNTLLWLKPIWEFKSKSMLETCMPF